MAFFAPTCLFRQRQTVLQPERKALSPGEPTTIHPDNTLNLNKY